MNPWNRAVAVDRGASEMDRLADAPAERFERFFNVGDRRRIARIDCQLRDAAVIVLIDNPHSWALVFAGVDVGFGFAADRGPGAEDAVTVEVPFVSEFFALRIIRFAGQIRPSAASRQRSES